MYALLGVAARAVIICDECVALGWDLLATQVGPGPPADVRVRFDDLGLADPRIAAHLAATARHLADQRARRVAAAPRDIAARTAHARAAMPSFRCAFCDAHRADVVQLMGAGPDAMICDACLEAAASVLTAARP